MSQNNRIMEIDLIRGVILIFMALDHFVYFLLRFHAAEFWNTPYPVFPAEFLRISRLISHLCAPGFVFLAGVSLQLAFLNRIGRGLEESTVKKQLLMRGGIIVLLQLLVEPLAWLLGEIGGRGVPLNSGAVPGTGQPFVYLGVLYAIGVSMLIGVMFLKRSSRVLAGAGVTAVAVSPLLIRLFPDPSQSIPWFSGMLFSSGIAPPFFTNYPLLPWLGVFFLGMAAGKKMVDGTKAEYFQIKASHVSVISCILLFAGTALRFFYPWGESHRFESSIESFFYLSKYPPSPAFLMLSLGSLGLLLALLLYLHKRKRNSAPLVLRPLNILGKEPLFFYFLHLFFYGLLCLMVTVPRQPVPALLGWLLSLVPLVWATRLFRKLRYRPKNPR